MRNTYKVFLIVVVTMLLFGMISCNNEPVSEKKYARWNEDTLFPKDADVLCNVNYGGSEGIYLDIYVRYEKDVYDESNTTRSRGWYKKNVNEHFATGKTLGDTIEDLDKMHLSASSVMAAFYGRKSQVQERYENIIKGNEESISKVPKTLVEKMKAANTKVKEQESNSNTDKSKNNNER